MQPVGFFLEVFWLLLWISFQNLLFSTRNGQRGPLSRGDPISTPSAWKGSWAPEARAPWQRRPRCLAKQEGLLGECPRHPHPTGSPASLGVAANHTSPVTQLLRIKAQAQSQPLCAHSDPLNSSCGEGMNE